MMKTWQAELRAIANCLTGISKNDLTTAELKIVDILIKAGILRFDIYSQVQLSTKNS